MIANEQKARSFLQIRVQRIILYDSNRWLVKPEPVCVFREAEGCTLILRRGEAERLGLAFIYPCRMITLTVHSSLDAVGLLARVSALLAERGISVNAVSAYYHDHLFVPVERAEEALRALAP
jgi:hypothetical protein